MSPEQISSATHGGLNPKAVERYKRKGGAERKLCILTISHTTTTPFCATHYLTEETECDLW